MGVGIDHVPRAPSVPHRKPGTVLRPPDQFDGLAAEQHPDLGLAGAPENRCPVDHSPGGLKTCQPADPARGEDCTDTEQDDTEGHDHPAGGDDVKAALTPVPTTARPARSETLGDLLCQL
jgi:hypothetical protein